MLPLPPPTTVPFANVIVKLAKFNTKSVGVLAPEPAGFMLMFMSVELLWGISVRKDAILLCAVVAASRSSVCWKMNSTAMRAKSRTRVVSDDDDDEEDGEEDEDDAEEVVD